MAPLNSSTAAAQNTRLVQRYRRLCGSAEREKTVNAAAINAVQPNNIQCAASMRPPPFRKVCASIDKQTCAVYNDIIFFPYNWR